MTHGNTQPRGLRQRFVAAAQHGLILFPCLWVLFGLFVLNEVAFDRQHQNHAALQGFALINAVALTKVLMLVEHLEPSGRLSHLPRVAWIVVDAAFCACVSSPIRSFSVTVQRRRRPPSMMISISDIRTYSGICLSYHGYAQVPGRNSDQFRRAQSST